MRYCLLYCLLLVTALGGQVFPVHGQEVFEEPASRFLTRVYFKHHSGGIIILKAKVADKPDELNFILDTGSSGISLDSTVVNQMQLPVSPSNVRVKGLVNTRQVNFVRNKSLLISNLLIDSLNFHINDYNFLHEIYGEPIGGIIGFSVLSRYIFKINYDSLFLEIYTPGQFKYAKGGQVLRPLISTLPFQTAEVEDTRSTTPRFLMDIGADLCLMFNEEYIKDSFKIHKKRKYYVKEASGLGGKLEMNTTVIKEFKLGSYKFKSVPVMIFNDINNITNYPFLAGIIGNDIYRRFNMVINYPRREVHLVPNSHFNDPFDYSYTGTELFWIDEKILIGHIVRNSPAEKAGLKEGDEVIAINNDINHNLNVYKKYLQSTNAIVKLIIKRNGEFLKKEIKVASIRKK